MKNDFGVEWTRKDYFIGVLFIFLIMIGICIPVGVLYGIEFIIGKKYHWTIFWIIFVSLFAFNIWITLKPYKRKVNNAK